MRLIPYSGKFSTGDNFLVLRQYHEVSKIFPSTYFLAENTRKYGNPGISTRSHVSPALLFCLSYRPYWSALTELSY